MSTHDESLHPRGPGGRWAEKSQGAPGPAAGLASSSPRPVGAFEAAQMAVGACPDCGAPMAGLAAHAPGRAPAGARGSASAPFMPGSTCSECPHEAADHVHETEPDEDGRTFEYRLESDGTIRITDDDGDTTDLIAEADEAWDREITGAFGLDATAAHRALAVRDDIDSLLAEKCVEAEHGLAAPVYGILADRENVPAAFLADRGTREDDIEAHFAMYMHPAIEDLADRHAHAGYGDNEPTEEALARLAKTCDEAGLPAMYSYYEYLAADGRLHHESVEALDPHTVERDYAATLGPAVDKVEARMLSDYRAWRAEQQTENLDAICEYLDTVDDGAGGTWDSGPVQGRLDDAWQAFDEAVYNGGDSRAALHAYADAIDAAALSGIEEVAATGGYNAEGAAPGRDAFFEKRIATAEQRLKAVAARLRVAADVGAGTEPSGAMPARGGR